MHGDQEVRGPGGWQESDGGEGWLLGAEALREVLSLKD